MWTVYEIFSLKNEETKEKILMIIRILNDLKCALKRLQKVLLCKWEDERWYELHGTLKDFCHSSNTTGSNNEKAEIDAKEIEFLKTS